MTTHEPPSPWQDPTAGTTPSSLGANPASGDPTTAYPTSPPEGAYPQAGAYAPAVAGPPPSGVYPPAPYGQPAYPHGGYVVPPRTKAGTNGLAIVSLILSLVGFGGCLLSIVAIVLGNVARKQIRETGEDGDSMAKAGVIIGWVGVAVGVLIVVGYIIIVVVAASTSANSSY